MRPRTVMASFLTGEAGILVETLSVFNDHESYMRGREEYHRESEHGGADCWRYAVYSVVHYLVVGLACTMTQQL